MPRRCEWVRLPGGGTAIVTLSGTAAAPRCSRGCGRRSTQQCDFPLLHGGTCDAYLCASCAVRVGPDQDYCPQHPLPVPAAPRVSEGDLVMPILRHLNAAPHGFLATSDLIAKLEAEFAPRGEDAAILNKRKDSKFSQKVRNLVSHRFNPGSIVGRGYAVYEPGRRGWTITKAGRARVAKEAYAMAFAACVL